jgi:hypothetical protein
MTLRFSIEKPGISACAAAFASCAAIRSWLGFSITAPNTLASLCSSTGLTSTTSSRARSKSSYRALVGVGGTPLSGSDQLQVTGVVWFCHGVPFARDRSASPRESRQTEWPAGGGKSGNRVLGRRA